MIEFLKRRLAVLIIIPMAAIIAAGAYSLTTAPVYRATAVIMVAASATGSNVADYNSLVLNRQLVKTFGELAVGQDSLWEVASQLKNISPAEIARNTTVSPIKDLELLRISVKDVYPERAAVIANKTVEVLRKKTKQLYGNDYIQVISLAEIPAIQEKPNLIVNAAAAGAVGLIFALIIVFCLEDLSLRKKTHQD